MLLLTYEPREDSNDRGYEQWLRDIDNPFFNSVPGIVHYENWKIAETVVGEVPYTHFDFLYVENEESLERVWANSELVKFAAGWTEKWGRFPDVPPEEMAKNYSVQLCTQVAAPAESRRTDTLLLLPYTPRADAHDRGYDDWLREVDNPALNRSSAVVNYSNWRVERPVLGAVDFTDFDAMYVDGPDAFERLLADPPAGEHVKLWTSMWGREPDASDPAANYAVCVCERISSPDHRS
jgi:hypothetical protein